MKSDIFRLLFKGFCNSNLRWKLKWRIFFLCRKLNYVLLTDICITALSFFWNVSVFSSFLLHTPDASSFAIIKANTQASNSFNSQCNLLQRHYWCRLRCFDVRIRIMSWHKRFLGMEVYSSTHSSLMPPTSESDSPSFHVWCHIAAGWESVCFVCTCRQRNLKAPFIKTIWWEK